MKKIISLCLVLALAGSVALAQKENRSWNFSSWSAKTLTLLETATGWKWNDSETSAGDRYQPTEAYASGDVVYMTTDRTAEGTPFAEFVGLNLSVSGGAVSTGNLGIVTYSTNGNYRLRVGSANLKFTIPGCKTGDIVVVVCASANSTGVRGIAATNATRLRGGDATGAEGRIVNEFKVDADGDVVLAATGGIELYSITVNPKLAYVTTVTDGVSTDAGDLAIVAKLSETYIVDYIDATATTNVYDSYDAIVLAALPNSSGAGLPALEGIAKPFVNLKPFQLGSRWNWGIPANLEGGNGVIKVSEKDHPIYAGITFSGENADEVTLATGSTNANGRILVNMTWFGTDSFGADSVVYNSLAVAKELPTNTTKGSDPKGPVISELAADTTIIKSASTVNLAYKTMVIGVSETANATLTDAFLAIVKNAVDYVLDPKAYVYPTDEEPDSTPEIAADDKVIVATEYYSLSGIRLAKAAAGFNIIRYIYEDGSTKSIKKFFLRD